MRFIGSDLGGLNPVTAARWFQRLKNEHIITHPNTIFGANHHLILDLHVIDEDTVGAAHVSDEYSSTLGIKAGVLSGNRGMGKHDVIRRCPTYFQNVFGDLMLTDERTSFILDRQNKQADIPGT